jgi:hypothetical protein
MKQCDLKFSTRHSFKISIVSFDQLKSDFLQVVLIAFLFEKYGRPEITGTGH